MLNSSTKDAIKVALAMALSICAAIWLHFDKPYWAAIAVLVMAMNESLGHAIQKGRNRLLGTILGIGIGLFLVIFLSQDRFLFLAVLTLFLAICVFMASNKKYGYIFTISFAVCSIVACIGGFNSQATFDIAILRIQETLLGITVYSFIYRLIWPSNTEDTFFEIFNQVRDNIECSYMAIQYAKKTDVCIKKSASYFHNNKQIHKLNEYLSVPLQGSYKLQHEYNDWKDRIKVMSVTQHCIDSITNPSNSDTQIDNNQKQDLLDAAMVALTKKNIESIKEHKVNNDILDIYNHLETQLNTTESRHVSIKSDMKKVLKAVCIFITALYLWIFVPLPGGYLFPMIAGIFSSLLPTMPDNIIKHVFLGVCGFGAVFTAQYVLIIPTFTEVWQLGGLYFINMFCIWKLFSKPHLIFQRMLGGNFMVIMTMGALHLTPSYSIETSLNMLLSIMITLLIVRFYNHLFQSF